MDIMKNTKPINPFHNMDYPMWVLLKKPTLFVIGLDRCTIVERSVTGMARELAFGPSGGPTKETERERHADSQSMHGAARREIRSELRQRHANNVT